MVAPREQGGDRRQSDDGDAERDDHLLEADGEGVFGVGDVEGVGAQGHPGGRVEGLPADAGEVDLGPGVGVGAAREPLAGGGVAFAGDVADDDPGGDAEGAQHHGHRRGDLFAVAAADPEQQVVDRVDPVGGGGVPPVVLHVGVEPVLEGGDLVVGRCRVGGDLAGEGGGLGRHVVLVGVDLDQVVGEERPGGVGRSQVGLVDQANRTDHGPGGAGGEAVGGDDHVVEHAVGAVELVVVDRLDPGGAEEDVEAALLELERLGHLYRLAGDRGGRHAGAAGRERGALPVEGVVPVAPVVGVVGHAPPVELGVGGDPQHHLVAQGRVVAGIEHPVEAGVIATRSALAVASTEFDRERTAIEGRRHAGGERGDDQHHHQGRQGHQQVARAALRG